MKKDLGIDVEIIISKKYYLNKKFRNYKKGDQIEESKLSYFWKRNYDTINKKSIIHYDTASEYFDKLDSESDRLDRRRKARHDAHQERTDMKKHRELLYSTKKWQTSHV